MVGIMCPPLSLLSDPGFTSPEPLRGTSGTEAGGMPAGLVTPADMVCRGDNGSGEVCHRGADVFHAFAHPLHVGPEGEYANPQYEPVPQHGATDMNPLPGVDGADELP